MEKEMRIQLQLTEADSLGYPIPLRVRGRIAVLGLRD